MGCVCRICPGQHLAEPFLLLSIAMSLATFNIMKAHDEHGNVIEPEIKRMTGGSGTRSSFPGQIDWRDLARYEVNQSHSSEVSQKCD